MKFIILLFFVSVGAFAENIDLVCVSQFPTTSFVMQEVEGKVQVRVIHHNGTKYMPIWEGIIVPNDLSTLQNAAEVLPKLGDRLEFSWDRKFCNQDEGLISCSGGSINLDINGMKVRPWALDQYAKTTAMQWGTFRRHNIALNLTIDGKDYRISNDFEEKECRKLRDFDSSTIKSVEAKIRNNADRP